MSRGSLLTLLGSIILAGIVAWMGNVWIERRLGGTDKPPDMVKVVVAAKDIPVDTKIDPAHLMLVDMLPGALPEGHLAAPEQVLGKRLKEPVYKGETIAAKRLLDESATSLLSVTLTPGKRAVAVRVDDIIGVSGFILPGSRVDVISTAGGQAHTVLRDIKVLTVGQTLSAEGGTLRAGSVTLEVDPVQAEILTEITEKGNVRLTLRHQADREPVEESPIVGTPTPAVSYRPSALNEPAPPEVPVDPSDLSSLSIVVIKGVTKTTLTPSDWAQPNIVDTEPAKETKP